MRGKGDELQYIVHSTYCIDHNVHMPRSGHAVVSYGKYMLLYGGIDFAEEAVYNDLYLLDTGKGIINQPMDVASILRSDAF
jgi:hypothetical protein